MTLPPSRMNADGLPGIKHSGMHPDDHIDDINRRIERADRRGGKTRVIRELKAIRHILLTAKRDAQWGTVLK